LQTTYDQQIPGTIGRWLGYRLVRSYLEDHPDTDWSTFLANTDSRQILAESGYRP
jgi:hypothetical protein